MTEEKWKPYPKPGDVQDLVEVSNLGRVRRKPYEIYNPDTGKARQLPENFLKPFLKKQRDGKRRSAYVSTRLHTRGYCLGVAVGVLTAFVRPRSRGERPHYKDGDPLNCTLDNLSWRPQGESEARSVGALIVGQDLGVFTVADIAAALDTSESSAHLACRSLVDQGLAQVYQPGSGPRPTLYLIAPKGIIELYTRDLL